MARLKIVALGDDAELPSVLEFSTMSTEFTRLLDSHRTPNTKAFISLLGCFRKRFLVCSWTTDFCWMVFGTSHLPHD